MKKIFLAPLCVGLLTICFTVFFSSCGGSDDDSNGGSNINTVTIIGQWRLNFSESSYVILTFNQDGTVRYYEYDHNRVEEDKTYDYTYSGGWLTISQKSKPVQVTDLSSSVLIIKDFPDGGSNVFTRIK